MAPGPKATHPGQTGVRASSLLPAHLLATRLCLPAESGQTGGWPGTGCLHPHACSWAPTLRSTDVPSLCLWPRALFLSAPMSPASPPPQRPWSLYASEREARGFGGSGLRETTFAPGQALLASGWDSLGGAHPWGGAVVWGTGAPSRRVSSSPREEYQSPCTTPAVSRASPGRCPPWASEDTLAFSFRGAGVRTREGAQKTASFLVLAPVLGRLPPPSSCPPECWLSPSSRCQPRGLGRLLPADVDMWSLTPPSGNRGSAAHNSAGSGAGLLSGAGLCRCRVPCTHTVVRGAEARRWWRKSREFLRRRYAHRASEHALGPEPCPLAVRVAHQRQRMLRVGLEGHPGLSSR